MTGTVVNRRWKRGLWIASGALLAFGACAVTLLYVPLAHGFQPPGRPAFTPGWRLPDRPITVLTYNIEFSKRPDEALEVVKAADPDVVCLQEIRPELMPKIQHALGMEGAWVGQYGSLEWGNAVLAKGRIREVQGILGPGGGCFGAWAAVEIRGGRFVVGSVHLLPAKSLTGGFVARERQTRSIAAWVRDLEAPAIIAGDFNSPALGTNYRVMSGVMEDAARGAGATLPSSHPLLQADWIFATRDWRGLAARRIESQVSDHYPVVSTLAARR